MAGETLKSAAICLDIRPWSRTSHIVTWLTPGGKLATVVKGAVRPKSAFLGQYDFNYTCEILYYARAKGGLHALRGCAPVEMRSRLRDDYRRLALAGYYRHLVSELAPVGPDCRAWYDSLAGSLDALASGDAEFGSSERVSDRRQPFIASLDRFELKILELSGIAPDFSGYDREAEWSDFSIESGAFGRLGGRCVRVSREVASYLARLQGMADSAFPPDAPDGENRQIPLDAARVIGVFYQFHLDCSSEVRRSVVGMISKN